MIHWRFVSHNSVSYIYAGCMAVKQCKRRECSYASTQQNTAAPAGYIQCFVLNKVKAKCVFIIRKHLIRKIKDDDAIRLSQTLAIDISRKNTNVNLRCMNEIQRKRKS